MLNNFRRGPESAGFSRQIESSVGEEPVPAPINTASDALRELVDDEGGAQQLGVDASRDAAWMAAASNPDRSTTQECINNTELIKHTSAAQR